MKYLYLLITFSFLAPVPVFALNHEPNFKISDIPIEVGIDEEFVLDISLDTNSVSINGVSATVTISPELEVIEINEAGSIIPLWVKRPSLEFGEISFAGIVPGGFTEVIVPGEPQSTDGKIVSMVIRPKQSGTGKIKITNQVITLHDGEGTEVENENLTKTINVLSIRRPKSLVSTDTTQPDLFFPKLVRDPNIFDGDLALFFETRDFESGIDRYEVREDRGQFVVAESPYRLRGQDEVAIITVRAIDRAGNDRTVELSTGFSKTPKILWPIVLVLVVLLFVLVIVHKKKRSQ